MLTQAAKKHVRQCGLDPEQVGHCIGNGAGHIVYEYGRNHVIKIPRFRWAKHNLSIITAEDAQRNLEHAKLHFAEYIPPAEIYPSSVSRSYCVVQHLLPSCEHLTLRHMQEHSEIARQFADILKRNQDLISNEGLSVDFFGKEGSIKTILAIFKLTKPAMANVVVEFGTNTQLHIVDSQLFEIRKPENAQLSRRMMAEASRWGFELNRLFAKGSFGHDLKK